MAGRGKVTQIQTKLVKLSSINCFSCWLHWSWSRYRSIPLETDHWSEFSPPIVWKIQMGKKWIVRKLWLAIVRGTVELAAALVPAAAVAVATPKRAATYTHTFKSAHTCWRYPVTSALFIPFVLFLLRDTFLTMYGWALNSFLRRS